MQNLMRRWLGGALFLNVLFVSVSPVSAAESSLEAWIRSQSDRSLDRVYKAISPADGALGSVMASPSRSEPNYYYHWIRDAALVMREVWAFRKAEPKLSRQILMDFALFSRKNQTTSNWSGEGDGRGVGEPKFHMDGKPFNEGWGRPQNDGPALRALTLIGLADDMMMSGKEAWVYKHLYSPELPARTVIKKDLEYVAHTWHEASFDLWEEVKGDHFYTRMTQWRALEDGAIFAKKMGDPEAAKFYRAQAIQIMESLDKFWSSGKGYLLTTRNRVEGADDKHSNLDIAIVLGVLHAGKTGFPFFVDDDRVIATVHELELIFDYAYAINRNRKNEQNLPMAPAIGRYPEDRYDGNRTDQKGNPWFLTTHAMAEYLMLLKGELQSRGQVKITEISRPFYEDLVRKDFTGKRKLVEGDPSYEAIISALQARADAFIRRSKFHTGEAGRQSEQYNRVHGHMQGAANLTWSYASFLSLRRIRDRYYD